MAGVSVFCIQLANHQKVKCLGIVKGLEVEAYAKKRMVNFYFMPADLGSYCIILGRPWLRTMNTVQDCRHKTISLGKKNSGRNFLDMGSRIPLDEELEYESKSSDEDSSQF